MKPYKNLVGKTFGEITVERYSHKDEAGKSHWLSRCSCGKQITVRGNSLSSGNTKSCGCKHRDYMVRAIGIQSGELTGAYFSKIRGRARRASKRKLIEFSVTREYLSQLFERQNRKCQLTGDEIVLNAPMGPAITASLDRIDSVKGYVPGNVQWIHKTVNLMKNIIPEQEFIEWCKKIANNN